MKEIKLLAGMIRKELEDSERYIKNAHKYKESDSKLAEMFYLLSRQEMEHANMEHDQCERLIREYAGEPTEAMRAVYEWEHEKMIDHTMRIKSLWEMYKA